ncbi:hypothetical protein ACIQF6_28305 [Kitasatospora sp. NPDC092948]|uniref:hypothetical protein n=1 Tax=Kitasatospora sp. NPDC092948 TaxID=3364088 RepID=UPI0037F62616
MAAETDLPDLDLGFATRDQLVRLAAAAERADSLAAHRRSEGARQVYQSEARQAVNALVEIVTRGGWPGLALVGTDGITAALVIASHASLYEQAVLLPALKRTVHNGGAPDEHRVRLETLIAGALGDPSPDDPSAHSRFHDDEGDPGHVR